MSDNPTLEKKIDNIEFTLEGIEGNVKSIKELLTGNPINATDQGMIGEFSKMKTRIEKLEAFNARMVWVGIGLSVGAGYSLSKIIQLFTAK